MKEAVGNLWTYPAQARVITTNGAVRSDGRAVMGRGVALQAKTRYADIDLALGKLIRLEGNHVHLIPCVVPIISFPVKRVWHEKADPKLITRSVEELAALVQRRGWRTIVLPRPGCGNGGLDWGDVKPLLERALDNRFIVVNPR